MLAKSALERTFSRPGCCAGIASMVRTCMYIERSIYTCARKRAKRTERNGKERDDLTLSLRICCKFAHFLISTIAKEVLSAWRHYLKKNAHAPSEVVGRA